MYDLIILGGGPAGVAAGVYAARKKIKTLLITKEFGGQIIFSNNIENWIGVRSISGVDFAKALGDHVKTYKEIEIVTGSEAKSIVKNGDYFLVEDEFGKKWETRTILVAIGGISKKLNIPGEEKFSGKGVFYCATCDAPIMKDKDVIVVGGGNRGLESAIDLLKYAKKVYILDFASELAGDRVYQQKLEKEKNVEIIKNAQAVEIYGDEFVSGMSYKNRGTGDTRDINASGVFIEIGLSPNSRIVKGLADVDKCGYVIVDHKTFRTSCDGIWAAGDVTDSIYKQINTAIGEGVSAILNISDYLKNK